MFGKVRKLGMKNEGGFWEKGNRVAGPCTAIQMNPRAVGRSKNPRRGGGQVVIQGLLKEKVFLISSRIGGGEGIAPLDLPVPTALQLMAGL